VQKKHDMKEKRNGNIRGRTEDVPILSKTIEVL
jgi:hypothetical protein